MGPDPCHSVPVTEHLIAFPGRDTAEEIAEELRDEGFTMARVVRLENAGEDDAEEAEWAVHVVEENLEDPTGPAAQGLRDRFEALAAEHDGWYDPEPSVSDD